MDHIAGNPVCMSRVDQSLLNHGTVARPICFLSAVCGRVPRQLYTLVAKAYALVREVKDLRKHGTTCRALGMHGVP